jgi:hypothetical protein
LEINKIINICWKKVYKLKDFFHEMDKEFSHSLNTLNLSQLNDEKKRKQFVLYENYICDVSWYMESHPGGANLIEKNLYKDMGRYMTGTQSFNSSIRPHAHNMDTIKYLISKMCYAVFKDNHGLIVNKGKRDAILNTEKIELKSEPSEYFDEKYANLVEGKEIALDIYQYKFKSQQGLLFARILPGVNWIGRHYSLGSTEMNKTRYYSACLSLNEAMKKKHLDLIKNIKRMERGKDSLDVVLNEEEMYSEYLHLYIKRYTSKNSLSDHIHGLGTNSQTDLLIRGPIVK